ncbi:MAG: hypothetical protein M5U34_45205 [Chloroflexi bacterium]|nr:hypothetical protein [Chloroflexota bacterium]
MLRVAFAAELLICPVAAADPTIMPLLLFSLATHRFALAASGQDLDTA